MQIEIPYEKVKKNYPSFINKIMADLKKGKSKEKGRPPSDLKWYISWSIKVIDQQNSLTPSDLSDAGIRKFLSKRVYWSIHAKVGRWRGITKAIEKEIPQEIIEYYKQTYVNSAKEEERFNNLTLEEQQAEIDGLLKELRKDSGFIEIYPNRR